MIPDYILDEYIDSGVFGFVRALNMIPDVYTMTTCEGHVWKNTPVWPTKDGWVHVYIPEEHKKLTTSLESFANESPLSSFELSIWDGMYQHHTFNVHYEPFQDEDWNALFKTKSALKQYWKRSDDVHIKHLDVWKQFEKITEDYIQLELCLYPTMLPYR